MTPFAQDFRRILDAGVASTLALAVSGCSLAFTTRPPADAERMPPAPPIDCSTSVAPPVIDTIIATYQAVRVGVGVASDDSAYRNQPLPRQADIAIGAGLLAVFTASAVWGYTATSACNDAHEGQLRRLALPQPAAPGAATPPALPPPALPPTPASAAPAPVAPPQSPPPTPSAAPPGSVAPAEPIRDVPF
mgnify:FL=1